MGIQIQSFFIGDYIYSNNGFNYEVYLSTVRCIRLNRFPIFFIFLSLVLKWFGLLQSENDEVINAVVSSIARVVFEGS